MPFSARWPPGAPANPGRPLCAPCRVHTAPVSPPAPHLPELTPHHCFWAKRAETTQIWNFDRSGPKHALRLWFGAPENSGGVCPVHLADSRSIPRCEFCTRHIPVHRGLRRRRRLRPLKKSHTSFSKFCFAPNRPPSPSICFGTVIPRHESLHKAKPRPEQPVPSPKRKVPRNDAQTPLGPLRAVIESVLAQIWSCRSPGDPKRSTVPNSAGVVACWYQRFTLKARKRLPKAVSTGQLPNRESAGK